ncbi:dimethyl sulfoxide reductase anchor subunit family protein [Providencia burhodogranariea]|uniref:Anaerobic dimethyl sulfoxide reductase subunit C n=1 Tax=Providencia burhodogranariea DSM 19968 TaxID=1141662 RepID=K8X3G7_9GAMM|nr:DmsC/YnfH family molybdoenzyme membrane anchor subunit [Providencia burhodogranariea]EKT62995.1 anaerobic dimethyl sulfoxide reductase subunit C [Providencia burhodogranariea DSM 19968]
MGEWPLVTFTLLVQSSVGIVILTALYFCWFEHEVGNQRATLVMKPALLTAAILGCLGLLSSTLHMGYPLNAFHALRHISSSWLSREIVFAALYLGALCLYTLFVLIKGHMNRTVLALIGILGLIDIFCMASLYFSSSMQTWMHSNTYFMFFGSVFAAGAAITLAVTAMKAKVIASPTLAYKLVASALVIIFLAIAIRLVVQPFYVEWLSDVLMTNNAITFPQTPISAYNEIFALRVIAWLISIAGILVLGYSMWKKRVAMLTAGMPLVLAGCAMIFIGEVLNRFAFFIVK